MESDMKAKPHTPVEIIAKIQELLTDLSVALGDNSSVPSRTTSSSSEKFTGPSGGVRLLLREGFFSTPKTRVETVNRLRQEGFNYTPSVVSVALLRQVRTRELVRLPSTARGKEKWAFAERK